MTKRRVQQGFVGGELSPSMYGRFDDGKYQQGLAMCRNFICLPQGPATNRPGFKFVREVKDSSKKVRLIPFIFSGEQTMCLEFGDKYVRFHTQGMTLLGSNGQPYEVSTPYEEDDLFELEYVQSMDIVTIVHPRYAPRELRRYGASDWRLSQISFDASISAPGTPSVSFSYSPVENDGVTDEQKTRYTLKYCVTALKDTDTGYEESSASGVGSTKGNLYLNDGQCSITWSAVSGASRYRVYKSYKGLYCYIGETTDTSFIDDNYEPDMSITPPIYEQIFAGEKGITSVTVTNQGSGYVADGGIKAFDQGIFVSIGFMFSASTDYEKRSFPCVLDALPTNLSYKVELIDEYGSGSGGQISLEFGDDVGGRKTLKSIQITNKGRGYVKPRVNIRLQHDNTSLTGAIGNNLVAYAYASVEEPDWSLSVSDSTGSGAQLKPEIVDGKVTSVKVINSGSGYSNPTVRLSSSYGSGATFKANVGATGDYPSAVCYFEQRRCFAGTPSAPQMIWMTRSGTETDMSKTIPVQDDNRVKFRIASQEAARILHLVPLTKLMALTGSTEFCINSDNSDAVSPTNISVKPQAFIGASSVKPVIVNSTMVYTAARGGHLRELGYNWQASGYVTGDLSLRAAHLFEDDQVVDITLSKAPEPILWMATKSGKLLGLTYLPEQSVGAWHRHDTTHGWFESVAAVPEGDEDVLYAVVRRVINGQIKRYVERMNERYFNDVSHSVFVDCASTYEGAETTTLSGLDYLEGETVSILANGCVLPQQVVKNGSITLSQASTLVQVGLPITSDLQTLPVALQLNDGSYATGHMKNVNEVWARLYQSSAIFSGSTFDDMTELKQRTTERYGEPPELVSHEVSLVLHPDWNDTGTVCIRQKEPLPLTVVSIAYELAE